MYGISSSGQRNALRSVCTHNDKNMDAANKREQDSKSQLGSDEIARDGRNKSFSGEKPKKEEQTEDAAKNVEENRGDVKVSDDNLPGKCVVKADKSEIKSKPVQAGSANKEAVADTAATHTTVEEYNTQRAAATDITAEEDQLAYELVEGTSVAEAAGLLNEAPDFSAEMNAIIKAARENYEAQQAAKAARKDAKQAERDLERSGSATSGVGIKVVEDEDKRVRLNFETMSGARQGEKISAAKMLEKARARQLARNYVDGIELYNEVEYDYGIERHPIAKERLSGPTARKMRKQNKRLDRNDQGTKKDEIKLEDGNGKPGTKPEVEHERGADGPTEPAEVGEADKRGGPSKSGRGL